MKRFTRVIASLLLLGLSVVGGVLFVWPSYEDFARIRRETDEYRTRLEKGEQVLSELENIREGVEAREEAFGKITLAIPSDPMVPALIDHVEQMASASGLVLNSVSEQVPPLGAGEAHQKILVNAELQGSYEGLQNFLDAAQRSIRIVTVNTLSVESSQTQQGNTLRIAIELVAYARSPEETQ